MSISRSETDILTRTIITLKEEIDELRTKLQKCVEILRDKVIFTDTDQETANKNFLSDWNWSDQNYNITSE